MANPTIGGIQFLQYQGPPPASPRDGAADISRPGTNGHALQLIGKRSQIITALTNVDHSNPGTLLESCRALIGTLVSVVLPSGTYTSVFVWDVNIVWGQTRKTKSAVGGVTAGGYWCALQWRLQNVST